MYQNFYCTLPNSLSLNQLLSIHTAYIKTIISTSNIHSILFKSQFLSLVFVHLILDRLIFNCVNTLPFYPVRSTDFDFICTSILME